MSLSTRLSAFGLAASVSIAAFICPDPVAGSVWDQLGSVKNHRFVFVDAFSGVSGAPFQHQLFSILTDAPNGCLRFRDNILVANEDWLVPNQIAWNPDNQTPAPFSTGTFYVGLESVGPDGTHYTAAATFAPHGKSCAEGGQVDASSGSITYTTVTDTLIEGHYDLWFGADHVTGTFSAPVCLQCTARPTKPTCIKSA